MKRIFTIYFIVFTTLFFSGCEMDGVFGPSKKELELKEKELDQKNALQQKELALKEKELNQSTELKEKQAQLSLEKTKAELDNKKSIELAKINSTVEKEKIQSQSKQNELDYELTAKQEDNALSIQKYILVAVIILIILVAGGLFVYFNNRRKDKLKAYEDNLEKYFRAKETDAKVQIANKILDTISKGNLNPETENKLIASLNGTAPQKDETKQLEKKHDDVVDLEVIDEETKEDTKKDKED